MFSFSTDLLIAKNFFTYIYTFFHIWQNKMSGIYNILQNGAEPEEK